MAWGGRRHSRKPFVDVGALTVELQEHVELLKDLKGYESTSRTASPDAQALVCILPVIRGLIKLSPSGEVHGKSLRSALSQLLVEKPEINNSKFNGKVWVNLRAERLTTILTHIREIARDEASLNRTAMVLTKTDFLQLKEVVAKVQLCDVVKQPSALVEVTTAVVPKDDDGDTKRVLKVQMSNCSNMSVDSDGFPKMLTSPCKEDPSSKEDVTPRSFLRKMGTRVESKQEPSSSSWVQSDVKPDLKAALGYEQNPAANAPKSAKAKAPSKAAALPKVASGSKSKAQPASLPKDADGGKVRKPWLKLKTTIGKNPPKAYICGSHDEAGKVHLIVEVTEKRSSQFLRIIDHILDALKTEHLSKNEALELRHELCLKHP